MTGSLLKGALVQFAPTFLLPLPNVILFQYNPETMTHSWSQPEAEYYEPGVTSGNPMAVMGMPGEQFSFTISLDSDDDIARGNPVAADIAAASGVYARLAALELLLYPAGSPSSSLLGTVSSAVSAAASALGTGPATGTAAPDLRLPVVLFVWGAGRIVPVRVQSLTITETLYDTALNPTHANAELALRVLTPEELAAVQGKDTLAGLAKTAYEYTLGLRQGLAVANLADAAAAVIGMLPT